MCRAGRGARYELPGSQGRMICLVLRGVSLPVAVQPDRSPNKKHTAFGVTRILQNVFPSARQSCQIFLVYVRVWFKKCCYNCHGCEPQTLGKLKEAVFMPGPGCLCVSVCLCVYVCAC